MKRKCHMFLFFSPERTGNGFSYTAHYLYSFYHIIWYDFLLVVTTITCFFLKSNTAQTMKFSFRDFFSKCDQICRKLRIWSHLLKKSLMKSFFFCALKVSTNTDKLVESTSKNFHGK